jgi:hypothetical protein
MSARKCPVCGAAIDNDAATSCPVCGAKLPAVVARGVAKRRAGLLGGRGGGGGSEGGSEGGDDSGGDDGGGAVLAERGRSARKLAPRVRVAIGGVAVTVVAAAIAVGVHLYGEHTQQQACVSTCNACVGGGVLAEQMCAAGCSTPGRAECFASDQTCAGLSRCELRAQFDERAATGSWSCRETTDCLFECGVNHACDVDCVAQARDPILLNGAIACVRVYGARVCETANPTFQECRRQ